MDASRFDAFAKRLAVSVPRRRVVKVLAALGIGGLLGEAASPAAALRLECPTINCPSDQCTRCWADILDDGSLVCGCDCKPCSASGIAGGGLLRTDQGGEAHLALVATRTPRSDRRNSFFSVGQVRWTDPAWEGAGLALESTTMTFYGPLPGVEGGREAAGWMSANGAGPYPFVLRVVDAGPPGTGQDTVALWVGDAVLEDPAVAGTPTLDLEPSGFRYVAEGTLVSGDLQLVRLASSDALNAPDAATPAI